MKVLTLWQPHATLIALGIKTIETRSWPAPKTLIGERIAIHAAKTMAALNYLCWQEDHDGETPDVLAPVRHLLTVDQRDNGIVRAVDGLPLGAIVATATLTDCLPMVHTGEEGAIRTIDIDFNNSLWIVEPTTDEEHDEGVQPEWREITDQLPYGDFTPGRFGWLLTDIEPLTQPEPFRGGQGLSRTWTPS